MKKISQNQKVKTFFRDVRDLEENDEQTNAFVTRKRARVIRVQYVVMDSNRYLEILWYISG